ncbi:hypothetical protein [Streptomyces himalayensis]|uniref:hypothetical protein n=1 Tax=Streptomyces himalayensis TaxID=2820085 RepID=UPI001C6A4441
MLADQRRLERLVVASGESPAVLDLVDTAFHRVPLPVEPGVVGDRPAVLAALLLRLATWPIFVGADLGLVQDGDEAVAIGDLSLGQGEAERAAARVLSEVILLVSPPRERPSGAASGVPRVADAVVGSSPAGPGRLLRPRPAPFAPCACPLFFLRRLLQCHQHLLIDSHPGGIVVSTPARRAPTLSGSESHRRR